MLQERFAENSWYYRTVQDLFVEVCQRQPDKTAIVFEGRETTYGELLDTVNKMSQALISLGVGKGDNVVMLPSPTPEFTYLYFAALQIGAIINPLNLLWGVIEFKGVLKRNDPKIIVTVDEYGKRDYVQVLRDSIPDLTYEGESVSSRAIPTLTHIVCLSRQGKSYDGFLEYNEFLERGNDYDANDLLRRVKEGKPTDVQFICQTSGTTGLSKSALWDHRPPLSTVNFAAKNLMYTGDERYINLTPYYHNSGIYAMNLNLVLAGCTLYLMEQFHPVKALEIIDKYAITSTFGFDPHWQAMRRIPNFNDYNFTITKATIATEPNTYDLIHEMCPEGAKINNLYAQTENGPLVSLGEHDCMDYSINKYTHGRPLPGVQVVIKSSESEERLPQGKAGEICYKSPFLFKGYYKQEKETQESYDAEGYFRSGDFGTFDNGYITFLGRLGGVVKSGGENVSTVRVTSLLLDHFQSEFDDVKTIGIPDSYWGAKVVSFVRTKLGKELRSTRELRDECKGSISEYEIPQEFLLWEGEWPVSAEGKISFKELEKEAVKRLKDE